MRQNSTQAEFMLSIYTIRLTVKFPCRMSLHQDGKPITTEVEPNANVFTFNQDVTIKVNLKSDVEINAYLSTGKGGSILAGLIAIPVDALAAKEGSRFTLPLQKCIDTAAAAEMKVNHAWMPQEKAPANMTRSSAGGVFIRSNSPPVNRNKMKTQNDLVQTRSQYQPQTPRKTPAVMVGGNLLGKEKQRQMEQKRFGARELGNTKISFKYDYDEEDIRETKTIGGTGQRYRRQKDKQRMEKLAAKKIADQTETNLKLDIMKYKMKGQELQKSMAQKVKQIKQLKDQIMEHERKNIQKVYLQQEVSSKQNSIRLLEDRISSINTENNSLRETIAQQLKSINQLKQNIRFDILKNKEDYLKKEEQFRVELTDCRAKIVELEVDATNKQTQLLKAKKYIEDLESAAEHKIFQHDRIMQDLKKEHSQALKEYLRKMGDLQSRIEELQKEISGKSANISQLKEVIIKLQQVQRSYEEKTQILEMEKSQLLVFKADFQTLTKKYASLEQTLREEQKNGKKALDSKNKQIADNQQAANKNAKSLQSKLSAANDKIKEHRTKIQELDNVISQLKGEEQKQKKLQEKQEKSIQELTFKLQQAEKEIKSHENRFQSLQKQLGEKSNNSSHMESLYKIELEHSKESVAVLTKDLEQMSQKYSKTKESLQQFKNEKSKSDNKIQLLQENVGRLNQYIKQKRTEYETKEQQLKDNIKNLNNTIKTMEETDKSKQKEINAWQIKDLTHRNKIDKLERSLEQSNNRIDKLQKVTIVKLQQQKQKLNVQLQATKFKLVQSMEQNKLITSERVKFESESNKNNKINTVLNEEKIGVMNQLNKTKNVVQRLEKNEEKLITDLKTANQENKKLVMKIDNLEKELSKNKDILNETVNSIFTLKKSMKESMNINEYQTNSAQLGRGRNPSSTEGLRKKQTFIDNLTSSRVMVGFSANQQHNTQIDVKRISQILESTSKEQQNTIVLQQQTINHYKDNIDKLEKELATLSFSSQSNESKMQETIDHLGTELESAHENALNLTNSYEDKISKLETEINKKEKDIKLNKSTIGSLKYELETLRKKFEIVCEEGEIKEHKSGEKMGELIGECNFLEATIKNLENEKRSLETKLYSTEEDLSLERDERIKKQKYINELSEKWTILRVQFEQLNKIKKQNLQELLSLRQQVQSLKQLNEKNQQMIKNQERNNKKLQDFINDLIKQKENIVKVELESSSKAIQMEGTVLQMKNLLQNKDEQIKQKEQQVLQCKNTIKILQGEVKSLEADAKETMNKINILNGKLEEKDRKIQEKENQLKEAKNQLINVSAKTKQQIRILKQQHENLQKSAQSNEQQRDMKIFSLQKQVVELETHIQSLSNELVHKEQLIFFQKQRASLSESTINDMKKSQSETHLMITKYEQQITSLNEQLTYKQQTLYEYSGKIYQLEQKIQAKQAQIAIRQEKVDMDWQCRHDEICEEYEHKVEVLEKDKKYMKDKLDLLEQEKNRLIAEKEKFMEQMERDIGMGKNKEKMLQQQKLQHINDKNKEIMGLKNQIALLTNQVKNSLIEVKKKQNEIVNKDEVIKKLQIRIHQNDRGSGSLKKQYEQEINNMKKNENAMKMLKDEIKNAQWATEREVKKITQVFIQKVVNCFPQAKEKLVEPIRAMQASMGAAINFKV